MLPNRPDRGSPRIPLPPRPFTIRLIPQLQPMPGPSSPNQPKPPPPPRPLLPVHRPSRRPQIRPPGPLLRLPLVRRLRHRLLLLSQSFHRTKSLLPQPELRRGSNSPSPPAIRLSQQVVKFRWAQHPDLQPHRQPPGPRLQSQPRLHLQRSSRRRHHRHLDPHCRHPMMRLLPLLVPPLGLSSQWRAPPNPPLRWLLPLPSPPDLPAPQSTPQNPVSGPRWMLGRIPPSARPQPLLGTSVLWSRTLQYPSLLKCRFRHRRNPLPHSHARRRRATAFPQTNGFRKMAGEPPRRGPLPPLFPQLLSDPTPTAPPQGDPPRFRLSKIPRSSRITRPRARAFGSPLREEVCCWQVCWFGSWPSRNSPWNSLWCLRKPHRIPCQPKSSMSPPPHKLHP